uniref:Transmembrane protein 17B n=1 Tax=Salvator merianae TaxID=96440 RepID=A0A8D0BFG2_SALMN
MVLQTPLSPVAFQLWFTIYFVFANILLGHTVVSSLPLQMMLYFNVFYLPFWCLSEGVMLELKYRLLPPYYQFLLLAAYLMLVLAEGLRLYLGYIGNLQEKVPELAGFLLLSFLIETPVLLFILTDPHILRLPLETAVHSVLLLFLASEIAAAFLALRAMTRQLMNQFYLKQFEEGPDRLGKGSGASLWGRRISVVPQSAPLFVQER